MIEKDFDVPFVAQLAQREKQIQQNYRPVIGVHKVMDTIFVCRTTGTIRASQFDTSQEALKCLLRADLEDLQMAGLTPTVGDARCLLLGHLIRLSVWQLRSTWHNDVPVKDKLEQVRVALQRIYPLDLLHRLATQILSSLSEIDLLASMRVKEAQVAYDPADEISF